ncbi:thioredoxin-dependent thiol peroxidase [Ammoniphilus sp. YIM 78166]|uniref:thioredoxin-dependent thiol peroxidase n=1 Tax=Ammoniphilus sp. YIM 78166 TaxID=1644106 RepID=UPI00106F73FA|nr:thioredoxin-dependent thiol peroxidase [Ammoniphilus sp. YIM 78166]
MTMELAQVAPDFTLPASNGENVTLCDFKGKNVVLYFYPKDMTPGCTTEACDFRDDYEAFQSLDTIVIGVSPDPITQHQKFIAKHNLNFILLADENHEVAETYGVWKLKKNYGKEYMGIERTTFVIDQEGKIAKVFPKVKVKGHVQEVLAFIKDNLQ